MPSGHQKGNICDDVCLPAARGESAGRGDIGTSAWSRHCCGVRYPPRGKPRTEGRRARVGLRDGDSGRCLSSEAGFGAVGRAATAASADRQDTNSAKRSFLHDAHLRYKLCGGVAQGFQHRGCLSIKQRHSICQFIIYFIFSFCLYRK